MTIPQQLHPVRKLNYLENFVLLMNINKSSFGNVAVKHGGKIKFNPKL